MASDTKNKHGIFSRQTLAIATVVAVGVVLAVLILDTKKALPGDEPGKAAGEHAEGVAAAPPGPHGGRMLTKDGYGIEATIFDQGSAGPEFRLYTTQNGKPLDPGASRVSMTLQRLGRPAQQIGFVKQGDYLKSSVPIQEPHSFKVDIAAQVGAQAYVFTYEQVEGRVAMSDQQAKQSDVQVLTAGPARIQTVVQFIGEVRLNGDRTVQVVPRLAGLVESVAVNAGDRVRKGQLLAVMSSQSLADQRGELLAAQQRLALVRTTADRERKLWEEKISAEQDWLQARQALAEAEIATRGAQQKLAALGAGLATGGNLTRYEILSPIDGVVTEKTIRAGQAVKEDANIFVVADLTTVWVEAIVPVKDLSAVKVGQAAQVKSSSFEAEASGTVSYVGAVVGEQTRTSIARVVLPNAQGLWRPGLPVGVSLVAGEVEVPVAVSVEAIQTERERPTAFARFGNQFEARPLELGRSDGRLVEVRRGLEAGDRYAAKNSFLIKAELGKGDVPDAH